MLELGLLDVGLLDVGLTLELPRLLLVEEQEPSRKVGEGTELVICALPVLVTGKFVWGFPRNDCKTAGAKAVDEAPGIAESVIAVIFEEVAL